MAPSTRLAPRGRVRHASKQQCLLLSSTSMCKAKHVLIHAGAGLCGFLAHGPLSHFWYLFCDNAIAELPVRTPYAAD